MPMLNSSAWRLAAIVLVGLNLRPVLASVGPLLDAIQRATGLSDSAASLLTTLPILLMGAGALAAPWLARRAGVRAGVWLGVALIGLACAVRGAASAPAVLLASALCAGLGIAAVQALLPAFIKAEFAARAGGVMGFYSTSIMGGAVFASVATPFAARAIGWTSALAGWALPAVAAALLWPLATGATKRAVHAPPAARRAHGARAWLLAAFFGLGTGAYTLVLAWLPPYYMSLGWSPQAAGGLLGGVTLAEVASGLTVSAFIDRLPDRRPALFAAIASLFVGLIALIAAPLGFALPASLLLGLGIGALFPLSLIVALDHATSAADAGALTGFVQGVGYLVAGLFPFAAGVIRQNVADLSPAWGFMAAVCVVMAAMAARLAPPRLTVARSGA
ncbi:MFS transporter [Burkholderia thailandensis]|uniref:MFS transporter n=5 Tax=Burkholderia thailandensis TaxID=57975 RepID=UPI0003EC74A1|nr:MFS transporter [Burkholderia thailandensis]AHI78604.1 major Facilitator Superfamily protein [Burkholderia thailandensis E444]AIC88412.1 major Facilitator Superfamily protein [Burkholderia thailandensis USAMRU Malaysia \